MKENSRNLAMAGFGVFVLFLGLIIGYATFGKVTYGYFESANWITVPATIQDLNLERRHSRSGRTTTVSFVVKGNYTYQYKGNNYQSSRIALYSTSDNIGTYWQDLYSSLRRGPNKATAWINPEYPHEAYLDRTLRWQMFIFVGMLFLIFCGVGCYIVTTSIKKVKTADKRLSELREKGISCTEKANISVFAINGIVFSVIGIGMLIIVVPEIIKTGNYQLLLFSLFLVFGIAISAVAFYIKRVFARFGPTPLHLDPILPGIGGQLGGRFSLNGISLPDVQSHNGPLVVQLTCASSVKKGKHTTMEVLWRKEVPLRLDNRAYGSEASFIFNIPDDCQPTRRWSFKDSIVQWDVRAHGDLSAWGFGDFQRTWSIEVGEQADQASSALNHLYAFTKKAVQEQGQKIENTALRQLAITEDDDVITIESKAGLVMESHGFLLMAAAAFAGGGALAALTGGLPGIMFGSVAVLVGLALFGVFVHAVGSAVETKIDTQNHLIFSTKSFYGYMHRTREEALLSADQLTVEVTGGYTSGTEKVEYCSLVFTDTAYKKTKLAKEIKDKQKAEELRELIISRCFPEKELAAAA